MNTTETLHQMRELKLLGMAASYGSQLELSIDHQMEGHELITHLLQAEKLHRSNERMEGLLKTARLRLLAYPEQVECSATRNFPKSQLVTLLEGRYLQNGENILITGSTGCGKSHIACALGYQACLMGIKTRYFNLNRLIESIAIAKTDGSYIRLLNQLEKISLIIIDDWGLQSLTKNVKLTLLQIMEDRYAKKSLIITSQLPVSKWHEYIDEPTLADAIMDRLSAKCHRIELTGESMRKKK